MGATQLTNIHDADNLVALCETCHFAFDDGEWVFLPKDLAEWSYYAKTIPTRTLREWNKLRSIEYVRTRLPHGTTTAASRDPFYTSGFAREPVKKWGGEPGVFMLKSHSAFTEISPLLSLETRNALILSSNLRITWLLGCKPCLEQTCGICHPEETKEAAETTGGDTDNDDGTDDSYTPAKGRKKARGSRPQRKVCRKSGPTQAINSAKPCRYNKRGSSAVTKNQAKSSAPPPVTKPKFRKMRHHGSQNSDNVVYYDKSVPRTHQWGYTYRFSTSNALMSKWQLYRNTSAPLACGGAEERTKTPDCGGRSRTKTPLSPSRQQSVLEWIDQVETG